MLVTVVDMPSVRAQIDLFVADGAFLVARARDIRNPPVLPTHDTLRRLCALDERLDIGGAGLDYDNQSALAWVAHPLDWFEMTPEALRWTVEHAGTFVELLQDVLMP